MNLEEYEDFVVNTRWNLWENLGVTEDTYYDRLVLAATAYGWGAMITRMERAG